MTSKYTPQTSDATATQNQVVEWLNEAGLAEGARRAALLRKANELMLHNPAAAPLLASHLDLVLCHAHDKNTEVKKIVITFIEQISIKHPKQLPSTVGELRGLVTDTVVAVAKRAIQATSIVYRHALVWICENDTTDSTSVYSVWQNLTELKLIVLNMIDSDNEGIRTHSIKFLEEVVVLQSPGGGDDDFGLDSLPPPPRLPFIDRRALHDEAEHIFTLLVQFHNSQHISSVNLMACMSTLCGISRSRPRFLPRVSAALRALHDTLPPTLTASQVNSVRKHLRVLVLALLRHPAASEGAAALIQLLADTGMTQQEINRAVPRERRAKRVADVRADATTKRPRLDSPLGGSQGSDSNSRDFVAAEEEPEPPAPVAPPPEVTEASLLAGLDDVENVMRLVAATLLEKLPDSMPAEFATAYAPIPNAGSRAQRRLLARALIGLIKPPAKAEPAAKPEPVPEPVPPPDVQISLLRDDDEKTTLKQAVAKLQESTKADRAVDEALEAARARHLRRTPAAPAPPAPPTPTVPKLKQKVKLLKLAEITRPIPKEIKERLAIDAVKRIIAAEEPCASAGASAVRSKLLALFAASGAPRVRDLVLDHVLEDPGKRLDLAMHWLYEEYAYMQGFARQPTLGARSSHEKHDSSYNRVLVSLAARLAERAASDDSAAALLRRLCCEAPLLTDDAAALLRQAAGEPTLAPLVFDLFEELCATRAPRAHKLVPHLLAHCLSEHEASRELAIAAVVRLHARGASAAKLCGTIEKHALLHLGFVALPSPPGEVLAARPRQPWDDRLYRVCVGLVMAIFPQNEDLIVEIARVYGAAEAEAKRVVLRALDTPLRAALARTPATSATPATPGEPPLPTAAAALLADCPRGADTLLTRLVHMLTEKAPPSKELVRRVRELYATRVNDVRFLIPVLTGLSKSEILAALPKLIKLNPAVVKEVFNKLLGLQGHPDSPPPVSPTELLVALHLIDPAQADLKYIIKATALCFAEKNIYTQDVVGAVVQRLSEQSSVPVLMLRSVLQALALYPALQSLVLDVLLLLVEKEVWNNKVAWEGWVKCCERLAPRSAYLIDMLPARAMRLLPPGLRALGEPSPEAATSHLPAPAYTSPAPVPVPPPAPVPPPGPVPAPVVGQDPFLPEPLPPGME